MKLTIKLSSAPILPLAFVEVKTGDIFRQTEMEDTYSNKVMIRSFEDLSTKDNYRSLNRGDTLVLEF